jgi:trans-2,3-dihydro-3-hydroxyanthranilate isomerase
MRVPFVTCDVFTNVRFGGNQLAVLPEASGLSDRQMQQVAREFNIAETAFVLPATTGHARRVRLFTPTCEIPFAGHPFIGTAAMLAAGGAFGDGWDHHHVTFEAAAGLVPVTIRRRPEGRFACELQAPLLLSVGEAVPLEAVAQAATLTVDDLVTTTHPPCGASVGLEFLLAEVRDPATLRRARPNVQALEHLAALGQPYLHLYARSSDGFDLRTRQFGASDPLLEDPATGSANAALVAMLAHHDRSGRTHIAWRIAQGVEMGRPSVLEGRAERTHDGVRAWIGGEVVPVAEGMIEVAS